MRSAVGGPTGDPAWATCDGLLRDIRELRMALYRVQRAAEHPEDQVEAELRVACLRGRHGPRPWAWAG
jgi:hypothetical protein